jgi:hypothetical protein
MKNALYIVLSWFCDELLPLFTILNLSCSGRTENGLCISSLITTFSAILIGLKTLQNDGENTLSEWEYDVKYSKKQ